MFNIPRFESPTLPWLHPHTLIPLHHFTNPFKSLRCRTLRCMQNPLTLSSPFPFFFLHITNTPYISLCSKGKITQLRGDGEPRLLPAFILETGRDEHILKPKKKKKK
jgi:hypothetical protein